MGILMSVEFHRGSPGKFGSRTLNRKLLIGGLGVPRWFSLPRCFLLPRYIQLHRLCGRGSPYQDISRKGGWYVGVYRLYGRGFPYQDISRKGGRYGRSPSSSSNLLIWTIRACPLFEHRWLYLYIYIYICTHIFIHMCIYIYIYIYSSLSSDSRQQQLGRRYPPPRASDHESELRPTNPNPKP